MHYDKQKNAGMPSEHKEMKGHDVLAGHEKYAGKDSMSNPEDLDRAAKGLVEYAKKHRMKY